MELNSALKAHCHDCGEEIQRGMKFCPHCGQDQAVVVPEDQRIPTEEVQGVPPPLSSTPKPHENYSTPSENKREAKEAAPCRVVCRVP